MVPAHWAHSFIQLTQGVGGNSVIAGNYLASSPGGCCERVDLHSGCSVWALAPYYLCSHCTLSPERSFGVRGSSQGSFQALCPLPVDPGAAQLTMTGALECPWTGEREAEQADDLLVVVFFFFLGFLPFGQTDEVIWLREDTCSR